MNPCVVAVLIDLLPNLARVEYSDDTIVILMALLYELTSRSLF